MAKVYLGPNLTTDDFPNGLQTIDDKLKVFADRVDGWQLKIARDLIERDGHAGFAVLHIVTSYIEMIAMYVNGPGLMGSKKYFEAGAKSVFPELHKENRRHVRWFLKSLYKNLRCGLYHQGMTRAGILLSGDPRQPYEFHDLGSGASQIVINPKLLVDHLSNHFTSYVSTISNPANMSERARFEAMFAS
jgi:hypothetical protein